MSDRAWLDETVALRAAPVDDAGGQDDNRRQGMAQAGEFDAIVVGGGSGGCVVTHRLVKAGWRVLLLEAGPSDDHPFIRMPATFVRVIGTDLSRHSVAHAQNQWHRQFRLVRYPGRRRLPFTG